MKEVIREKYLEKIRPFYDSDLIKIIIGVRRCGKSVLLTQIISEIEKSSDNIIFLNFEKREVYSNIKNEDQLYDYIISHKKEGKCYLFLDEVETITNYQNVIKSLRLKDCSIFITGSNSKLLSKEFTKELSGRYVSFQIHPFVYKEIIQ